jgi:hypothetical protein
MNFNDIKSGKVSQTFFLVSPKLNFALSGEDSKKVRTFKGVAYSGEVVTDQYYWESVIFDLAGVKFSHQKMPVLKNHDPDQILGYTTRFQKIDNRLEVEGVFLNNSEKAQEVTNIADEGYPWQLSVHIMPDVVKTIDKNETTTVNGKTVNGPIVIFSQSTIREVSFCAVGADRGASATVFSLNRIKEQPKGVDMEQTNLGPGGNQALALSPGGGGTRSGDSNFKR